MKKSMLVLFAAIAVFFAASSASADFSFSGPITVIVPFNAGSTTDSQLRLMQGALEKELGTTLVIVNKSGGSGTIGTTEFLNGFARDGYTVLYSLATPVIYRPLTGDTAYVYDDLRPVARTSSLPMYVILADSSPFKSAAEIIDYIKANPGKFTYANVGNGGNGHLAFASFLHGEGLEARSVPYSGGTANCYAAAMGGEVDAAVYGEADLLARPDCHGAINLGSRSTVEKLQGVPTLADLGYEGYETNNLAAFYYAKDVPEEAVNRFAQAVKNILSDEAFVQTLKDAGFTPSFGTAEELDAQSRQIMKTALPVLESLGMVNK